jgi:hypothetical protein
MKTYSVMMLLSIFGLLGCQQATTPPTEDNPSPTIAATITQAIKSKPIIFYRGVHPTVRHDYYMDHPHAFDCKDDPYSCKECPVGKPDRVIKVVQPSYMEVPDQVNGFFACSDINMLVPEQGLGVDSDQFICQREPQDGFIELNGHRYSCKSDIDQGHTINLGDLQPGETKTLTIPVQP